jgi:CO dehydrogenase nickel-insertion accessory protein CooC1
LGTKIGKTVFAFTRVADGIPQSLLAAARETSLPDPLIIPEDPELRDLDAQGKPLVQVSEESKALEAVKGVLSEVGVLEQ